MLRFLPVGSKSLCTWVVNVRWKAGVEASYRVEECVCYYRAIPGLCALTEISGVASTFSFKTLNLKLCVCVNMPEKEEKLDIFTGRCTHTNTNTYTNSAQTHSLTQNDSPQLSVSVST